MVSFDKFYGISYSFRQHIKKYIYVGEAFRLPRAGQPRPYRLNDMHFKGVFYDSL